MTTKNTEGEYNTPQRSIKTRPTPQTVLFCGKFINISVVALRAGVSPAAVSMIFSGKRNPSYKTLKKIGEALNMNLSALARRLSERAYFHSVYSTKKNNPRVRERR